MANKFMHFLAAFVGVGVGMVGMNIVIGSIFGRRGTNQPDTQY